MWKVSSRELKYPEDTAQTALLFKMAAKQAMKENLQCTSKYGLLHISQDICHVRMTDVEDVLTIYGHSDNLLNNNTIYKGTNGGVPHPQNMGHSISFISTATSLPPLPRRMASLSRGAGAI